MRMRFSIFAVPLVILAASSLGASAAFARDGAVITNSGSTNSPGYTIKIWSDGSATQVSSNRLGVQTGSAREMRVPDTMTRAFFSDVRAARDARASGRTCVKSASFGYRLNVRWHGWISPDLSCPGADSATKSVAADVRGIESIAQPAPAIRRGLLPNEVRKAAPDDMRSPLPSPTTHPSSAE